MDKRKLHIEIDLETEEFQSKELLEKVAKIAIEKVFFVDVKVTNVLVSEVRNENTKNNN